MTWVIGGCCGEHSRCGAAQGMAMWLNTLVVWILLFERVQTAVYLNKWAVEILGGPDVVNQVAADYGFRNLGQIGTLENYYLFEEQRLVKRSANPSRHHHVRLKKSPQVLWVEQQSVKRRFKREYKVELDRWKPKLNDPVWSEMWYLNQGARGGHDMNVIGAWRLGYTGKGVVVTILDDGIEYTHSDLQQNYDPKASFDINDSDDDPLPRYDKADENRHGTRCAGEVAAVANNSQCGVGVAFQARIGGVRMLDGDVSDVVEAEALSLNPQYIDIYSASWGPEDNGKVVDGPAKLAKEAFAQGIIKGRDGKGSIYIWASGNGGSMSDSCSCDGYANSIYTLSVSSSSEFGTKPWYLEECSSTLATTYSSGENYRERKIVTTDLHNRCIDNHTGTSASAPLAAGMCALALEANRNLTWRDMQYIVLMSARSEPLRDAQWVINGVGRQVSHRYGYGLMDGQAMVLLAERWTTVPEQHVCPTEVIHVDQQIDGSGISMTLETNGCKDTGNEVNYLEHIQAKVSLTYSRRGDLQVHLISPNGTRSTLLPRRKYDYQYGEFRNWSFMSVFYWGEQPQGRWTLVLENVGSQPNSGIFEKWELIMYGTKDDPINLKEMTPIRPTVHVPAQGQITTDSDPSSSSSATLDKWNMTESATTTVTRPKPISTLKQKPKPGLKTTPKQMNKATKTMLVKTKTTAAKPVTVSPTQGMLAGVVTENVTVTGDGTQNMTVSLGWKEAVTNEVVTVEDGVKTGGSAEGVISVEPPIGADAVLNVTEKLQSPNVTKSVSLTSLTTEEGTILPFVCDIECTNDGCSGPGPENCVACQHARLNGHCVNFCPNLTFYDSLSGACLPCEPPCLECTGPTEGNERNCRSCTVGYFFHVEGNLSDCLENCPSQFYADVDERSCIPCSPNCLVCADDPSNCLHCADDFDFLDSTCVVACKLSEFRDEDGSCRSCDVSCETCVGPEAGDCVSCASDRLQENDLCVANCSEGYYIDITDATGLLTCQMCHPACSTCFGPGDDECFSCYHPLKLYAAACVEDCPSGHFEDYDATCHACHEDCAACIGSQENDCLDCWPTRFYFDGRCAENCSEGLFPIEVFNHVTGGLTNRCELCHGTCQTCSGGSAVDCIRCFKGLVLSSGRCVAQCESNKYQEDDHCLECHEYCSACYGPLNDQCLECQTDHYLLSGQCLTDCPHGYYRMDGQCHSCSMECNGCSDNGPDNCITCSDDFVMYHGVCIVPVVETIPDCSFGQFYSADELSCESCHDSCQTCSGRSQSQCLSCFAPNVLHTATGRCFRCCVDVDVSVDVTQCCTCDHVLGLCIELWNNLRPEITSTEHLTPVDLDTRWHDVSTSHLSISPSIPSAETAPASQELSSAFEDTSIPSSSVTTQLSSSYSSLLPVKPKSSKPVTSTPSKTTFRLQPSPNASTTTTSETGVLSTVGTSPSQTARSSSDPLATDSIPPSESENTDEIGIPTFSSIFLLSTTVATGDEITTAMEEPGLLSPWVIMLFLVLCLGTVCAVTFIVIFCCLQAKAGDKLCWSKRHYRQVPVFYRGANQAAGSGKTIDMTVAAQV